MLWVARNLPEPGREEWRRIVERNKRQGFFGPPIEMNNVRCREMHTELVASREVIRLGSRSHARAYQQFEGLLGERRPVLAVHHRQQRMTNAHLL